MTDSTNTSIRDESAETGNISEKKDNLPDPQRKDSYTKWLRARSKSFKIIILISLILLFAFSLVISIYFGWFRWLPDLWTWGTDPISLKIVPALLGAFFLVFLPIGMPLAIFQTTINKTFSVLSEDAEHEFEKKMEELKHEKDNYERILDRKDDTGLLPLVKYSSLELEQYYRMGINQSRNSFIISIIAMSIGFVIIMSSFIFYLFPIPGVNQDLLDGDFYIVSVASGTVLELISGLFFWIYKRSKDQMIYFYNRQIFIHNALLAFNISSTMDNPDESKKVIIEKILEFGFVNRRLFSGKTDKTIK
jgi:hypothetical protein